MSDSSNSNSGSSENTGGSMSASSIDNRASTPSKQPGQAGKTVALFASCLVDLMRPQAGFAALALLQDAGYEVVVPEAQSCCGQPGYNSGDYRSATALAKRTIQQLESYEYIVIPSGSCAGMLREHYAKLLEGMWRERAERLSERVFELTAFLHDVAGYRPTPASGDNSDSTVAYHDACAGLRELGVREQPRQLLSDAGIHVSELAQRDVCCGFGGTFCAKMPEISAKMADDKLADIAASGATEVVAGDIGCLLALSGRARRLGHELRFRHVAEVLASRRLGREDAPGIGEAASPGVSSGARG